MMTTKYRVELAQEGCDVEFAGDYNSLAEAIEAAKENPTTLPQCMYETARAAGHVGGMHAPDGTVDDEPLVWVGDYAISRVQK